MTDILVTMPMSRGGLKHLEKKIEYTQMRDGYAWWWVKQANRLEPSDLVGIVCERRLRGKFSIKWIIDSVEADEKTTQLTIMLRDIDGRVTIKSSDGVNSKAWRDFERIDGSIIKIENDKEFTDDDMNILLDYEEWYREGMQTIFFDEWFYDLEQPEMKGFQGFRYRR